MSSSALITFYMNNAEILVGNNIALSAIRILGWWLLRNVLVPLASACKSLFDNTFALIDFTSAAGVNQFIDSFKPVFIGLMSLSLFALGIMLIFNHEKKPKFVNNICLAILCVTCSTLVFQQMNTLVLEIKSGIDSIQVVNEGEQGSADGVYDILSNNLIDLYHVDQEVGLSNINYANNINVVHPNLTKESFHLIDYNEVLDPDEDMYSWRDANAEDILEQKVVLNGSQNPTLTEIYNGVLWTSAGNNFYYRYNLQAIPVTLQLISLIVLYLALSYKCFRLIFELAFGRLMAYLFSAELSGGQRLVKILQFIRDTYIALLLTVCSEKLYYIFSALLSQSGLNALMQAFLIACLAFIVIDGPNIAEKVLGIDIGLSSAWGHVFAMARLGKWGANIAGRPVRAAANEFQGRRQAKRTGRAVQNAMQQSSPEFMENKSGVNAGNTKTGDQNSSINNQKDSKATSQNTQNSRVDYSAAAAATGKEAAAQAEQPNFMEQPASNSNIDHAENFARNDASEQRDTSFMEQADGNDPQQFMDDRSDKTKDTPPFMDDTADRFMGNGMDEPADRSIFDEESRIPDAGAKETSENGRNSMTQTGNRIIDKLHEQNEGPGFMQNQKDAASDKKNSSLRQKPTQYGGSLLHRNPADTMENGNSTAGKGQEENNRKNGRRQRNSTSKLTDRSKDFMKKEDE